MNVETLTPTFFVFLFIGMGLTYVFFYYKYYNINHTLQIECDNILDERDMFAEAYNELEKKHEIDLANEDNKLYTELKNAFYETVEDEDFVKED